MKIDVQTFTEEIDVIEYITYHEEIESINCVRPIRNPDDFVVGKRVFYELNTCVDFDNRIYKKWGKFKEITDVQDLIFDLNKMKDADGEILIQKYMEHHNFVQEV